MPTLVFSTGSYGYLEQELCADTGYVPGQLKRKVFLDGERYHRFLESVHGRDVLVIGGTIDDSETLELYDLVSGVVHEGAATVTIVIPYLGYSTMDRAVKPGEVVKAKTRARLFSSLPQAARGNRIVMLDLHVEGLQHYFEGAAHPFHVYARPIILEAARELGGSDFVLACTDAGRAKWVESLGYELGMGVSFVFKRRADDGSPHVTAVSALVEGKHVVIYDDMIRSGQSLLNAARAYREAGAASLSAIATHGLFPGDSLAQLRDAGILNRIVTTNSHPRAPSLAPSFPGFLEVRSVAPVIQRFLEQGRRDMPPSSSR